MNLKRKFAAILMAATMVMTHGTAAMASEFTEFIVGNEIWSYADKRNAVSNEQSDVLGASRVNMPFMNGVVASKSDSCIRVIENGNVKKVMPANINVEDGTYTVFSMCPGRDAAGVIVFTNDAGGLKTLGETGSSVSVSKTDSLILYSMVKNGTDILVQA